MRDAGIGMERTLAGIGSENIHDKPAFRHVSIGESRWYEKAS